MSPAEKVIEAFGGVRRVATLLDIDRVWVWRWTQPKNKRGTGGKVPASQWQEILRHARDLEIDITLKDLAGDIDRAAA